MKKKLLPRALILLLSIVMMFTLLVACVKPKKEVDKPIPPTPPTIQDYLKEVGQAMDKAFSINAGKPFNVDFVVSPKFEFADKSKEQNNWDYSIKLKGNINFAETIAQGQKRANELDFAVVNNITGVTLFALSTDSEFAYMTVGDKKTKFDSFDFYSAIHALSGKIFDKESSLADVDIVLAELLPLFGGSLFTTYAKTAVAGGFDYNFNFNLKSAWDNIIGTILDLLPMDINVNEILGQLLNCPPDKVAQNLPNVSADIIFNVRADEMVGIDVKPAILDIGKFNLDTELNCNPGINASFNLDKVRADFANIEAVKLLNINMSGTINLVNDANPTQSFYTLNWKLMTNMDPMLLVQEKLNLSSDKFKDNYLHFQLSHICNDGCRDTYCKDKLSSYNAAGDYVKNDKVGALLDIAFAPASIENGGLGNSNINVAFNIRGLLSKTFLSEMLKSLNVVIDDTTLNLVVSQLPKDTLLSLNLNSLLEKQDDLGKAVNVIPDKQAQVALAAVTSSININSIFNIIQSLSSILTINPSGLTIDMAGVYRLLGNAPIIGDKSIAGLIGLFLNGKAEKATADKIIIAGDSGIGSKIYVDLFNPSAKDYNVYNEIIVYSNRENKVFREYDNSPNLISSVQQALIIKNVVVNTDGTPELYTRPVIDKPYVLFNGQFSATSIKDIGNYFIKYSYIDVKGRTAFGFANIVGTSGLRLNETDSAQDIKLLTTFTEGKGVLGLLTSIVKTANVDLDLTKLPIAANMFEVKFKLAKETKFEVSDMDKTSYAIGEAVNLNAVATITYDNGTPATINTTGIISGGVNSEGRANVPGKYKITYYVAGRYVVKDITISAYKDDAKYTQGAVKAPIDTAINKIDFGNVSYTLEDGTTASFKVTSDMVTFNNSIVANGKLVKIIKTKYTVNVNGLVFANNDFEVDASKSTYIGAYDNDTKTISFTNNYIGLIGQEVTFNVSSGTLKGESLTDTQIKSVIKINGEFADSASLRLPIAINGKVDVRFTLDLSNEVFHNLPADQNLSIYMTYTIDGKVKYFTVEQKIISSKFVMTANTDTNIIAPTVTLTYVPGDLSDKVEKTFKWGFTLDAGKDVKLFLGNTEILSLPTVETTIKSEEKNEYKYSFTTTGMTAGNSYKYTIKAVDGEKTLYKHTTTKTDIVSDSFEGTLTNVNNTVIQLKNIIVKGNNGVATVYPEVYIEAKMFINDEEVTTIPDTKTPIIFEYRTSINRVGSTVSWVWSPWGTTTNRSFDINKIRPNLANIEIKSNIGNYRNETEKVTIKIRLYVINEGGQKDLYTAIMEVQPEIPQA